MGNKRVSSINCVRSTVTSGGENRQVERHLHADREGERGRRGQTNKHKFLHLPRFKRQHHRGGNNYPLINYQLRSDRVRYIRQTPTTLWSRCSSCVLVWSLHPAGPEAAALPGGSLQRVLMAGQLGLVFSPFCTLYCIQQGGNGAQPVNVYLA